DEAPLIKKFLRFGPFVPSQTFHPAGIEPPFTNHVNIVPFGTVVARFASSADTLSPIVGPASGTAGTTTGSILPALVCSTHDNSVVRVLSTDDTKCICVHRGHPGVPRERMVEGRRYITRLQDVHGLGRCRIRQADRQHAECRISLTLVVKRNR